MFVFNDENEKGTLIRYERENSLRYSYRFGNRSCGVALLEISQNELCAVNAALCVGRRRIRCFLFAEMADGVAPALFFALHFIPKLVHCIKAQIIQD